MGELEWVMQQDKWTTSSRNNWKYFPIISWTRTHCAGALYALGGHVYEGDGRNALKSMEQYDGGEGSWQAVAPMPLPLEFHSAVAYKNKIYVLEGESVLMEVRLYVHDLIENPLFVNPVIFPSLPSPYFKTT